jgi:hypothetical protein
MSGFTNSGQLIPSNQLGTIQCRVDSRAMRNVYQFISGRALHGIEPRYRNLIIKEWQAENPSLKLELGSFQNPYWIPATTSFNWKYTEALFKSVPVHSWYGNWSVQQKLP